jgi:hypothetical protein
VVPTDVTRLPVPSIIVATSNARRMMVGMQRVAVNERWWRTALQEAGLPGSHPECNGHLSRSDLFEIGEQAASSPAAARELLWASLSWSTGLRERNSRRQIESVARDAEGIGALLVQAATVARKDAEQAYELLRTRGRNTIPYLGPPFFTKFLYFSGGGAASHPCLILDSRVAETLQRYCGWKSLTGRSWWTAWTYGRYCALVHRWTAELSTADRTMVADEVEVQLLMHGAPDHHAEDSENPGPDVDQ